jgi:arylsulfatase A-like enzyme
MRWPGFIKGGEVCSTPYASWDIMPTLAQLAQLVAPSGIDGISFATVLTGGKNPPVHEFLYWEYASTGGNVAVRAGNWKLVRKEMIKEHGKMPELYDLSVDPGEHLNVANKYPDIVRKLKLYIRTRTPASKPEWNFIHN